MWQILSDRSGKRVPRSMARKHVRASPCKGKGKVYTHMERKGAVWWLRPLLNWPWRGKEGGGGGGLVQHAVERGATVTGTGGAQCMQPCREGRKQGRGEAPTGGPLQPQRLASRSLRSRWPVSCVSRSAGPGLKSQ
jgi:hypothetical protein